MNGARLSRPLIVTRRDMDGVALHAVARGEVAVYSHRSPIRESDSEDGAAVSPVDDARAVLAVADGLGGQRSGAEAADLGVIDEKEAIHHEDRHLVSNIVGTPEMRIEVGRTLSLRPRDTVVLGGDGLFDNPHLAEITEYLRKGALPGAAQVLADDCRQRMCEPQPDQPSKPDDMTFLVYRRRG